MKRIFVLLNIIFLTFIYSAGAETSSVSKNATEKSKAISQKPRPVISREEQMIAAKQKQHFGLWLRLEHSDWTPEQKKEAWDKFQQDGYEMWLKEYGPDDIQILRYRMDHPEMTPQAMENLKKDFKAVQPTRNESREAAIERLKKQDKERPPEQMLSTPVNGLTPPQK